MQNCLEKFCLARETAEAQSCVVWTGLQARLCRKCAWWEPGESCESFQRTFTGWGAQVVYVGWSSGGKDDSRQESWGQVGVHNSPRLEVRAV